MDSISALQKTREIREKYEYLERMAKAEFAESTVKHSPSPRSVSVDEGKQDGNSSWMQPEMKLDSNQQASRVAHGDAEEEITDDTITAALAESFRRQTMGDRRRSIAALEASTVMPRRRPVPFLARRSESNSIEAVMEKDNEN